MVILSLVLRPSTDNIDFGPNIKKYQDHIVFSYDYKLVCVDDWCSKLYKTYLGGDAIDKFLNYMIKESECCSEVTEPKFNKLPVMNKKDNEDFKNSTKCCICKKEYEEGEVKVKDHDHITGKCPEYSHQDCNLNRSLSKKKIPFVFHNFQNCDLHLIFQEIGKYISK